MNNLKEIRGKKEAILDRIEMEKREANQDEQMQLRSLQQEYEKAFAENQEELQAREAGKYQYQVNNEKENMEFRSFLKAGRVGSSFELRDAEAGTSISSITSSQTKTVRGVLDSTLLDATVYDKAGCPVQYGASGINDWEYAGNVSVAIQGELVKLGDAQAITTTGKAATQQRISVKVLLSNQAINNAGVDLIGLAKRKINDAYAAAINFAACAATAYGTNFKGGFADSNKQTYSYTKAGITLKDGMAMVGKVAAKNYDVKYGVFVMTPAKFYELKATPKDAGSGLMLIGDDNTFCGFPVMVTNAIGRTSNNSGTITDTNIGFGLFNALPCLQHGSARLTIDANSVEAANVDGVYVVCNADWSMTNLRPDAFVFGTPSAT